MMAKGRGGLENAALDAFEALTRSGCVVTTVLRSGAEMQKKFPSEASILPLSTLGAWDPTEGFRLWQLVKHIPFDVVLAHGNRAAKLARSLRSRGPLVLVCHTTNYSATRMIDHIDGAIVLTNHYHEVMVRAGCSPEKVKLVPNAIRLGPEPKEAQERTVPLVGGLGRLVPNKGFDILLQALGRLKLRGIRFECIIHGVDERGSTSDFEALRSQAGLSPDDVAFPGWTTSPHDFLRSLDIFAMPSRREVLSIALLEALEAGRPIVCARVPGLEDVFTDGGEGFFVDIGDVGGLEVALEKLLLDASLRSTMGKAARERARRFEIGTVGVEMREALQSLAATAARSRA